eukprot:scaffold11046_cov183-Amphora_coffeaeformis.AAC.17
MTGRYPLKVPMILPEEFPCAQFEIRALFLRQHRAIVFVAVAGLLLLLLLEHHGHTIESIHGWRVGTIIN